MQEGRDSFVSWDTLGRLKAQADAWQESFTQKCSKVLRETGSLGDESLCMESTELENFMYSIMDMEKALLSATSNNEPEVAAQDENQE